MRGQRTLFADILPQNEKPKADGIGRDKKLVARRNSKLIARYYFYAQLQKAKLDYTYIIGKLSDEFDISDFRIIIIMQENHAELKEIFTKKPEKKQLQEKYPHLVWS
jgi:protein-tyrosine-phosphatase